MIAGGLIVVLATVSVLVYVAFNLGGSTSPLSSFRQPTPSTATVPAVAGIPCDGLEHTQVHYHIALQIVNQGALYPLPSNAGITGNPFNPTCLYWLHVHPSSQNVIHVEAPDGHTFTLGNFFEVWSAWSGQKLPLDVTHVATLTLRADQKLLVFVDAADGKGPLSFTGDPASIILIPHEVITLEITPPTSAPPEFKWQPGL